MVYMYHDGVWYKMSGKKAYHTSAFVSLAGTDKLYHSGVWYPLDDPIYVDPRYSSDQYGKFPAALRVVTYECTADTEEDPDTGDTIYSNWRWELMSSETALRAPALENPSEYPQWRYYTIGEQGQSPFDFSVEVDTTTGHIIGYGNDLHNPQGNSPPPPAAGIDYYMDTVTRIYATEAPEE